MEKTNEEWLCVLREAASLADTIAMQYFGSKTLKVKSKANHTPVSEADTEIENAIRDMHIFKSGEIGIVGEEFGLTEGSSTVRLLVDPIDATQNFIRGIPIFASLMAISADDDIVAGLVSSPALGQRWSATLGDGAFKEDLSGNRIEKLHVSDRSAFDIAQVFHSSYMNIDKARIPEGYQTLIESGYRQRGFGDFYQHMLVAEGAGEVAIDLTVSEWDIAPLKLIIEEAGGKMTSVTGTDAISHGSMLTTNGLIHDTVIGLLNNA